MSPGHPVSVDAPLQSSEWLAAAERRKTHEKMEHCPISCALASAVDSVALSLGHDAYFFEKCHTSQWRTLMACVQAGALKCKCVNAVPDSRDY